MALTLEQMMAQFGNDPMKMRLITSFLEGSQSRILPLLYFVNADEMLSYTFSVVSDLGDIGGRLLNGVYVPSDSKAAPKRETLGIFGGSVNTDQILIDARGDASRLTRIDQRMAAAGKYFDSQFINGDPTTDPKQFRGLRKRSEDESRVLYTGDNGGALTLDLLDQALDAVAGDNGQKKILCNRQTRRRITKLMRAAAGGSRRVDIAAQAADYDGAEIRTIAEDNKFAAVFPETETRGNSSICTSLYVVRFGGAADEEFIQGIKGPTWMKLRTPVNYGTYVQDNIDNIAGIGTFGSNSYERIAGINA